MSIYFIEKAKVNHNSKYSYDKVIYLNSKTKVTITCSIHGEFRQSPANHLSGRGCPVCGINISITKNSGSLHTFIEKSNKLHNHRYLYDKTNYINCYTKVCITCTHHGDFWQLPKNHLVGNGCPKCSALAQFSSTSEFIKKANQIHNNKYSYKNTLYVSVLDKVQITCSKHGNFWQRPKEHLEGYGCQICKSSSGELKIVNLLEERKLEWKSQYRISDCRDKTHFHLISLYLMPMVN